MGPRHPVARSCSGGDFRTCAPPEEGDLAALPARLSETGLFADASISALAPGVRLFTPRFQLWSDGAAKRRWILLPPGGRIDTSDMDDWQFPEGTKLWKEFTRDGVRVETRLLEKSGPRPEQWRAVAYVWLEDQSDAVAVPEGRVDALGAPHDIPSASQCFGCHGGRRSRVLGFSAIQLSSDASAEALDLDDLIREGALSEPPAGRFEVPGNEVERAALGYVHANCGYCHNQERPETSGPRCFDPQNPLDFWLRVDRLGSPRETPTYVSGMDFEFVPGEPDRSLMIQRISGPTRGMPALGPELEDAEGVALLRRWIAEMKRE